MGKSNNTKWFTVTRDLNAEIIAEPSKDIKQIFYLVKKILTSQEDLFWYDYELFDSELEPTQLTFGDFICKRMYEIVPKASQDVFWFGFEIVDGNGVTRKNELQTEGKKGLVEIIKMMRKSADFGNWANYDAAVRRFGSRLYD